MTTFRFKTAVALIALPAFAACSPSTSQTDNGVYEARHTEEITRILTRSAPTAIEQDLSKLLREITEQSGSPGTELVSAGFQPAPEQRQLYGWKGLGVAGPTSVDVAIDGERITVKAKARAS